MRLNEGNDCHARAFFREAELLNRPRADGTFTVAEYCKAYRRGGNYPQRARQIHLIGEIGRALDHYVKKPFIRGALHMMRQPARLAGMGVLQDFLERGFNAFHAMRGADHFLGTIDERERAIMDAIIAGAVDPFPDPLLFRMSQPAPARG